MVDGRIEVCPNEEKVHQRECMSIISKYIVGKRLGGCMDH